MSSVCLDQKKIEMINLVEILVTYNVLIREEKWLILSTVIVKELI